MTTTENRTSKTDVAELIARLRAHAMLHDEALGGECFSNPRAKCPDCDGHGELIRPGEASNGK